MTLNGVYRADSKRLGVQSGILIDADTWQEAHGYHLNRLGLHIMAMHEPGIVNGLEVFAHKDGVSIVINSGFAVGVKGTVLHLPEPRRMSLEGFENTNLYILLTCKEEESLDEEDMTITHTGQTVSKYCLRECKVTLQKEPPQTALANDMPQEDYAELARLQLTGDNLQVQDAANTEDPLDNQIDLRYRSYVGPAPAGRLTIGMITGATNDHDDHHRMEQHIRGVTKLVNAINNQTGYRARFKRIQRLDEQELDDCCLLIISGQGTFKPDFFNSQRQQALKGYMEGGGILLGEVCAIDHGFSGDFHSLSWRLGFDLNAPIDLPEKLLSSYYVFSGAPLGAVANEGAPANTDEKSGVILSQRDYGCAWGGQVQDLKREVVRSATEFGINLAVFSFNRLQDNRARKAIGTY